MKVDSLVLMSHVADLMVVLHAEDYGNSSFLSGWSCKSHMGK